MGRGHEPPEKEFVVPHCCWRALRLRWRTLPLRRLRLSAFFSACRFSTRRWRTVSTREIPGLEG